MCKCLPRNTIKVNGLLLNIIIGIILITPIFLTGFDYNYVNLNWSRTGKWRHIGKLQISSVSIAFFSFILGFLFFGVLPNSKPVGAIFSFIEFCSGVFSMFVAIFVLVGAYARTNELTEKCIIPNKNFFENFFYLNDLFAESDKSLCTSSCPCDLTDYKAIDEFLDDSSDNEYFYNYTRNVPDKKNIIKAQDCEDAINSFYEIVNNNNRFGILGTVHIKKLMNFWGRIEKKFHCTGWCQKTYKNENEKTVEFKKYLFSDINKGVVKNIGCMKPYRNWVQKMLRAFGGLMLIDSFLQLICLIFGVSLLAGLTSENSSNERPEYEDYGAMQKNNQKNSNEEEHDKSN
jgi:hypothetical protein